MIDKYGKIIFPFHSADCKATAKCLLEKGANELDSVLEVIVRGNQYSIPLMPGAVTIVERLTK